MSFLTKLVSRRAATGQLVSAGIAGMAVATSAQAAPQPHMDAALKSLRAAKEELEKAEADKGGHRVKALELVNQAIAETEEGIRYADQHG